MCSRLTCLFSIIVFEYQDYIEKSRLKSSLLFNEGPLTFGGHLSRYLVVKLKTNLPKLHDMNSVSLLYARCKFVDNIVGYKLSSVRRQKRQLFHKMDQIRTKAANLPWMSHWNEMGSLVVEISNMVYRPNRPTD